MNSWEWITPNNESSFIYYQMLEADKLRKNDNKFKDVHNETYKIYKRALWDTLNACKKSICDVSYNR